MINGSAERAGYLEIRRKRVGPDAPEWTPELRRLHARTVIDLAMDRLRRSYNLRTSDILNESGLASQLGSMADKLRRGDREYARNVLIWTVRDMVRSL